jgi:acetyl-CoA C-acetyltransferase
VHDLAAPIIDAVRRDARLGLGDIEEVILGNALYGGGNPARLAALAAVLPETVPAMTLDTQCCAGLDAIGLAAARIMTGERRIVAAGGVESFSRAPIRMHRPLAPEHPPQAYDRPPFTPFPGRDPDMLEAAAALASLLGMARADQEAFAVESHRKARAHAATDEIVAIEDVTRDAFTRELNPRLCARLPVLAGEGAYGVTAATTAVEADAAAIVLVAAEDIARRVARAHPRITPLRILGSTRVGGDPTLPGLAPIVAGHTLMRQIGLRAEDFSVVEIMEAFAAQAMACRDGFAFDPARVNRGGGALARGHPIGASGAVLAVRLWHELQHENAGAKGLALIAAAGGLGSALAVLREAL